VTPPSGPSSLFTEGMRTWPVPVAQELAVRWTFEDGKAIRARSFTSREEALAAAGIAGD
jgi:hypothetical protein